MRMRAASSIVTVLMVLLLGLLGSGLLLGGCTISMYNRVIGMDERVKSAWAQVENQLQRRYDLIPNLVETVKGYAEHESELFTQIAEARTKYFQAAQSGSRDARVEAATGVERLLSRLLVLRETYPELKAQESFLKLQDELAGTENRLSVERKRYNDAVRELNTFRRTFFGQFVAGLANVEAAEYFEPPAETAAAPKVNFGGGD